MTANSDIPASAPLEDWFHQAALAIGFIAHTEGWLHDSRRVKQAVYELYESGELKSL